MWKFVHMIMEAKKYCAILSEQLWWTHGTRGCLLSLKALKVAVTGCKQRSRRPGGTLRPCWRHGNRIHSVSPRPEDLQLSVIYKYRRCRRQQICLSYIFCHFLDPADWMILPTLVRWYSFTRLTDLNAINLRDISAGFLEVPLPGRLSHYFFKYYSVPSFFFCTWIMCNGRILGIWILSLWSFSL